MTKIAKVKTREEHVWNLMVGNAVVGRAEAIYKTATQRVWNGEFNAKLSDGSTLSLTLEGLKSAKKVNDAFLDELGDRTVAQEDVVVEADDNGPNYPAVLLPSMINEADALDLSAHYGYKVVGTAQEQAEYLLIEVRKRNEQLKTTPWLDIVEQSKRGKIKTASKITM